jgi:dipeptidyl aminopeptidase/acylaminoacyl peptidase
MTEWLRDGVRRALRRARGGSVLLIIGAVWLLAGHVASGGERLTPERLLDLARLGSACLSPQGDFVVYAVRRYDLAENRGRSELRVVTLPAQQDRVLLDNLRSADDLQWAITAQGPRVLFVGVPGGDEFQDAKPQVWSVDPRGGAPQQVTSVDAGVSHLKVSPTGTHVAFTAEVKLDSTVTELYPDLPKADARIIDSLMYRHWDAWHDYSFSHLHVAPLPEDGRAGTAIDLMTGVRADCPLPPFGGAEQFHWSPDGKELAFTAKVVNNPAESTDSGIYVVAADGQGRPACITAGMPGADTEPTYAPNGQFLAFHSMERAGFEADKNRILVYDRARRTLRDLTAQLDQTTQQVTWMPDSRSLVFKSEHRGCDQLFRVTLDTAEVTQISRGTRRYIAGRRADHAAARGARVTERLGCDIASADSAERRAAQSA